MTAESGSRGSRPTSLRAAADAARAAFDAALAVRDADAAASPVLDLEQALADWTADTLQSDDADHARRTLRGMVLELARGWFAPDRRRLARLLASADVSLAPGPHETFGLSALEASRSPEHRHGHMSLIGRRREQRHVTMSRARPA